MTSLLWLPLASEWMKVMNSFWQTMLDKLTSVWYNGTPERETGSVSLTTPLQKDIIMGDFANNKTQAKIQGLSIQVGELFADLYKGGTANADAADHALEAYKSLRRSLPREYEWDRDSRHVGATAAHKATQGA